MRHRRGNAVVVTVRNQRVNGDDFRTHIEENGQHAKPHIRETENAGLLTAYFLLLLDNVGQMRGFDEEHQRDEHGRHDDIRHDDPVGELLQHSLFLRTGSHLLDALEKMLFAAEQGVVEHEDADHAGHLVANTHDAHTPCRRLDRSDDRDVWVAGCLQQRQPTTLQEQTQQEQRVTAHFRARNEHQTAHGHHH